MKKLYALISVLVIGLIALSAYCFKLNKKLSAKEKVENTTADKIQTEAKIIARKVDEQGFNHVTVEAAAKIIPHVAEKDKAAVSIGILDTTAMAIGILKTQVENLTIINTNLKAENLKAYQALDENSKPVYRYTDRNLHAEFKPGNPADTADKGEFKFIYDADLTLSQYWKRNKVLGLPIGAKNSFIDIYSNDPRATIKGVKRLTVKQDQTWLGLRVQAVTNYNLSSGSIHPGAGLQFDAGRFSVMGSYIYNLDKEIWQPSISGRYDLMRF